MRLLTKKYIASLAAKRWENQYKGKHDLYDGEKQEILDSLIELGENPEPEEVDLVIGNDSWTDIVCHVCRGYVEEAVSFPHLNDEGGCEMIICRGCVKKLLDTLTPVDKNFS